MLEFLLHFLVAPVLVQAVAGAVEKALVTNQSGERVGANTLITDMAELDTLVLLHRYLLCFGHGCWVHARQSAHASAEASVLVLLAVIPVEDDGFAEQNGLLAAAVAALERFVGVEREHAWFQLDEVDQPRLPLLMCSPL